MGVALLLELGLGDGARVGDDRVFSANLHKPPETSPLGPRVHTVAGFQLLCVGVRFIDGSFQVVSPYRLKRFSHSSGFTFTHWRLFPG